MKRITYIEDMALEAEVIQRLCQMCGDCFHGEVEFEVFGSLGSALADMDIDRTDVVLLDMTLPDSTQEETIQHVEEKAAVWPPIIMLTGAIDPDLRRRCILSGADDFLFKKEAHRNPTALCERIYNAALRRERLKAIA